MRGPPSSFLRLLLVSHPSASFSIHAQSKPDPSWRQFSLMSTWLIGRNFINARSIEIGGDIEEVRGWRTVTRFYASTQVFIKYDCSRGTTLGNDTPVSEKSIGLFVLRHGDVSQFINLTSVFAKDNLPLSCFKRNYLYFFPLFLIDL